MKDALIQTLDNNNKDFFLKSIFQDFGFIWSVLILFLNFMIFIFSAFWIGAPQYPEGVSLFFFIIFELFLCIDIFLKILLKRMKMEMKFFIFMDFDGKKNKIIAFLTILSVIPTTIIFTAIEKSFPSIDKSNTYFGNLLFLKLFRIFNIIKFVTKFKEMLIFMNVKAMITLKFIENIIIIMLSIHISASLWMYVSRNQSDSGFF